MRSVLLMATITGLRDDFKKSSSSIFSSDGVVRGWARNNMRSESTAAFFAEVTKDRFRVFEE